MKRKRKGKEKQGEWITIQPAMIASHIHTYPFFNRFSKKQLRPLRALLGKRRTLPSLRTCPTPLPTQLKKAY